MGKALRTAGAIVAGAALIIATGGTAALVAGGASLGAAAAYMGSAATLGLSTSAWITAGTILSGIGGALSKPQVGDIGKGSQIDWKADTRAGIPYVVGETGTAGQIVFANTAEPKNHLLAYLTVHSLGPIDGIVGFRANGSAVTFSGDNAVEAPYHDMMWERRQLGELTSAPFMPPAVTPGTGMPEWTEAHRLTGLAAQWWVLAYDKNAKTYPTGTPKPLTILRGVKVYDPRQDSTYPGGSGACRAGQEGTYVYSENPFLHALTFLIGRFQNGKRVIGLGAPVGLIDVPAFVEGANVADTNGWKIGGVVYSTDRKWEVFKAMLQAGGGWPLSLGAKISCGVLAPKVSLDTITGADIVGPADITGAQSKRNRYNAVIPTYRSADHDYELVPAEPIEVSTYVAEDDGVLHTMTPEFPLVPDVDQAAELGVYGVANSREFGPVVLPCKPRWRGFRPGDCITVDEPDLGLNGQKMLIVNRRRDWASGIVTLTMVSETDAKHPFALGKTGTAPPTPGLTGVDGSYIPTPDPGTWAAVGAVLAGPDGSLPVIKVSGAADAALISAIIVEYRERLTEGPPPTWGPWVTREYPPTTTEILITDVKPGATYQVRIRYRNTHGAEDPDNNQDLGSVQPGAMVASAVIGATAADIVASILLGEQLNAAVDQIAASVMQRAVEQWAKVQDVVRQNNWINGVPSVDYTKEHIEYLWILGDFDIDAGSYVMNQARVHVEPGQTFAEYTTAQQSVMDGKIAAYDETISTEIAQGVVAATRTTALGVWAGDNGSLVLDHANVKWTSSETLGEYIEGVRSQIGTDLASYDSSIKTWVNGSSAGASWIANLEASFGGDFHGQIVSYTSLTSALGAKYGVTLDVNGYVTGFQINNSGSPASSAFVILASNFALATPGQGTAYPFAVEGGYAKFANPVTIGAGTKKVVLGPGFGASGDLVFWFGPSSTAIGAMTKTNGHWAWATDGKTYYGSAELGTGASTALSLSLPAPQTSTTSLSITATPLNGTGPYTYRWTVNGPDSSLQSLGITVTGISGAGTATLTVTVSGSPPPGEFGRVMLTVFAEDSSGLSVTRSAALRFNGP
ncbi:hypothetical protein [Phenylobacterium sp.]|uniref:hypothetical protein n=1 Tax=Phenylobacterium sp. TaxID=1871053 RepID=UPI00393A45A5